VDVRPLVDADRLRAATWIRERWGDEVMAAHGELFAPAEHEGFVAGDWEGLATYRIDGDACEVTLIEADARGRGTGSALLRSVVAAANRAGCSRVWLVTTNDNAEARAWYERRGFQVTAVREGAVDRARESLKPSIPTHNARNGLRISDEIELSLAL
jgi:N-acetylglutamate synthase-like GNAT family acetyltransferase